MQNIAKLKKKASGIHIKNVQNCFFSSAVMSKNPYARLEKLCLPVMIVKLRKGQKYTEILKTVANFIKFLLKLKILKSSKPFFLSQENIYYPYLKV